MERLIINPATIAMGTILAGVVALAMISTRPASADCIRGWCAGHGHAQTGVAGPAPGKTWKITDERRRKIGDLYNPGTGRIQIRDNHTTPRIVGYIEADGTISGPRWHQEVGSVGKLLE